MGINNEQGFGAGEWSRSYVSVPASVHLELADRSRPISMTLSVVGREITTMIPDSEHEMRIRGGTKR